MSALRWCRAGWVVRERGSGSFACFHTFKKTMFLTRNKNFPKCIFRRARASLDWCETGGRLRCASAANELHSIEINRPPKWHIIFSRILRFPKTGKKHPLEMGLRLGFLPHSSGRNPALQTTPINKGQGGWVQKEKVGRRNACVLCGFLPRVDSVISMRDTCFT